MHMYKKALGIGGKSGSNEQAPSGEIRQLNNIDVIDQSQEEIKVEEQVTNLQQQKPTNQNNQLEISIDESQEEDQTKNISGPYNNDLPQPKNIASRLNADIIPTPPSES